MKLFDRKEECCGCTACFSVCPKSAITMQKDEEGFFYPSVNQDKCIGCHRCEQICGFRKQYQCVDKKTPLVFGARINERASLLKSSSGGIFTVLSDLFLEEGNAVVCSVYDWEEYAVRYVLITNQAERDNARGSKYLKSDPGCIFSESEKWLKRNPSKRLLFVGMGCEVDGFRAYLDAKKLRTRVTLVDIICHGGGSPLVWNLYAKSYEQKSQSRITQLYFKDKRINWYNPVPVAVDENGNEGSIREYVNLYNSAYVYRPSCYVCPYASVNRNSDITIGDYWGIEKIYPDFYDPMGNSVVLIHTDHGKEIFDKVRPRMSVIESGIEECRQHNLSQPTKMPVDREKFWLSLRSEGIEKIIKKYGKIGLVYRAKRKVKRLLKKLGI